MPWNVTYNLISYWSWPSPLFFFSCVLRNSLQFSQHSSIFWKYFRLWPIKLTCTLIDVAKWTWTDLVTNSVFFQENEIVVCVPWVHPICLIRIYYKILPNIFIMKLYHRFWRFFFSSFATLDSLLPILFIFLIYFFNLFKVNRVKILFNPHASKFKI